MCSTQLSANGGPHAALNMYAHEPGAFTAHPQAVAGLFGAQGSLLHYSADHDRNLGVALGNRDMIGQAKGSLMERFDVDGNQVFQMLVRWQRLLGRTAGPANFMPPARPDSTADHEINRQHRESPGRAPPT